MKRVFAFVLSLILAMSLVTTAFAERATSATVGMEASVSQVDVDGTFTVVVKTTAPITGFRTMSFHLNYDSDKVTFASVQGTSFKIGVDSEGDPIKVKPSTNNAAEKSFVGYVIEFEDAFDLGASDLVTVTFKGVAAGDAKFSVSDLAVSTAEPGGTASGISVTAPADVTVTIKGAACEHEAKTDAWVHDSTGHWRVCSKCGEKMDDTFVSHTNTKLVEIDSTYHKVVCQDCGEIVTASESHSGVGAYTNDTAQHKHYQECACGVKIYSDHVYDQEVANDSFLAAQATCTSGAVYYMSCVCGAMGPEDKTFTSGAVDPNNHARVMTDEAVPATCTATGLTEGSHCDACKATIVAQTTTAKIAHDFGTWTVETPATEEAPGLEKRVCKRTGCDAFETREIQQLDHTHAMTKTAAKEATCTESGNNEYYTCSKCHKVFKDAAGTTETNVAAETLPALKHSFTSTTSYQKDGANGHKVKCIRCDAYGETVAHTFDTNNCKVEATCTACGYEREAGEHVWGEPIVDVNPGCTTKGHSHKICGSCDVRGEETDIEPLGHQYGAPTFTWTDDYSSCKATFTCTREGCTEQQEKECNVTSVTTPSTCKDAGKTVYTATASFEKYNSGEECKDTKEVTLSLAKHTYGNEIPEAPATCTENGTKAHYKCSVCEQLFDETKNLTTAEALVIPATDHDWKTEGTIVTPATCTEDGEMTVVCKNDESHQKNVTIPATNHKWGEWNVTKEATCAEEGSQTRICENNEEHTETVAIAKLPHDFKDGKCTVCGELEPVKPVTPADNTPTTPTDTTNPKTGDAGVGVWVALLTVTALFGTAIVVKKRHA